MVMEVLEQSFETDVYHEHDRRAFVNYHMKEPAEIRGLIGRSGARCVVVKCLLESQRLLDLLEEFRPAKALWVLRDYRNVTSSMLVSFRNQAAQAKRIAVDRNADGWLGERMSDSTHAIVASLVKPDISDASAAALQWWFRNARYFEQALDADPRVMLARYEDIVQNPRREFRRICAFAGIAYSDRMVSGVQAGSNDRRPPPAIAADIESHCMELMDRFSRVVSS